MSFPEESLIVSADSISSSDVLIEDRMIGAMKSTSTSGSGIGGSSHGSNDLESKAAGKVQFYSRLIDALAESILGKNGPDKKKDWAVEKLKVASKKILDIVTADDKIRRFIWKRQLPEPHFLHLSQTETVNKIANDLLCRIRKLDAMEDNKRKPPPAEGGSTQLKYANCLVLIVCTAIQSGETPYRAILALDRPPFPHQLSVYNSIQTDSSEAASKRYHEKPNERGLRLQLRQRLLACVRTKKPFFTYVNALLAQWGLPPVDMSVKPKLERRPRQPRSVPPPAPPLATKKVSKKAAPRAALAASVHHHDDDDDAKAETANATTAGSSSAKHGMWRFEERKAFLKAFELYPVGHWFNMAELIPNRNKDQVARFGRYVAKKFHLSLGEFANEEVRSYLLRPDDRH